MGAGPALIDQSFGNKGKVTHAATFLRTEAIDPNGNIFVLGQNSDNTILEKFKLEPKLYLSQNLYFQMSLDNKELKPLELKPEWLEQFSMLGDNLGVKVEQTKQL